MLYKLSYKIMDQLISLLNELSNEFQILTVLYEKKKKRFSVHWLFWEHLAHTWSDNNGIFIEIPLVEKFYHHPRNPEAYHATILAYAPISQKFEPLPYPYNTWSCISRSFTTYETIPAWAHHPTFFQPTRRGRIGFVGRVACPQSPQWGRLGWTRGVWTGFPRQLTATATG